MWTRVVFVVVVYSCFCVSEARAGQDDVATSFVPGKGLEVKNADGSFRLVTNLFGQVLYTSHGDRTTDDWEQSLEIRRARLIFSGNAFGVHNKFYLQIAISPQDMKWSNGVPAHSPVFDWYYQFDYLRDLSFQVGQYRVPYTKQRRVPIAKLQMIDRTIANFEFNLDRDIGFNFYSQDFLGIDLLRYYAGLFIGEGRDAYALADFGLLYCARWELFPLGLFDDYVEADLERRARPALVIGAAYAYLDDAKKNRGILGNTPTDGGTTDTHNLTADIMVKFAGLSLFSEFYYRQGKRSYGETTTVDDNGNEFIDREEPRDGVGWFAQLGWLLPWVDVEPVLRYSQVHPVRDESSLSRNDELGTGINWYINGHSIALATDYHYRFPEGEFDKGTDEIRVRLEVGF